MTRGISYFPAVAAALCTHKKSGFETNDDSAESNRTVDFETATWSRNTGQLVDQSTSLSRASIGFEVAGVGQHVDAGADGNVDDNSKICWRYH